MRTLNAPMPVQNVSGATHRTYEPGDVIFVAGDVCDRVYYLRSGLVKLSFLRKDGAEKIVTLLGPGSILGEAGVFCNAPESMTAVVVRSADVLALQRSEIDRVVSHHPEFCMQLIRSLSKKVGVITGELESTCRNDALGRVAYALHQMGMTYGVSKKDGRIEYRVTHEELARMAGTCRVTVTNVLSQLRNQGIIDQRRAAIVINDSEQLIRWAT